MKNKRFFLLDTRPSSMRLSSQFDWNLYELYRNFYSPVSKSLNVLQGSFAPHATISQLAASLITQKTADLMERKGLISF